MVETYERIGQFIALIKETVEIIDQSTDAGTGIITVNVNDTYWITELEYITIDGKLFKVTNLDFEQTLYLKPKVAGETIDVDSFELTIPPTSYFHGTLRMTQDEIDKNKDKRNIVPFIWLYEILREKENLDEASLIEKDVNIRLFFCNTANFKDFLTQDHYERVIKPLNKLVNSFLAVINKNRFVADDINYVRIPLVNFSIEGKQEKSIFDLNLDAVELNIDMLLRKDLTC